MKYACDQNASAVQNVCLCGRRKQDGGMKRRKTPRFFDETGVS